jgi:hypothetical protein
MPLDRTNVTERLVRDLCSPLDARFIVRDHNGHALCEEEPPRQIAALEDSPATRPSASQRLAHWLQVSEK